jgi:hypothetical protein
LLVGDLAAVAKNVSTPKSANADAIGADDAPRTAPARNAQPHGLRSKSGALPTIIVRGVI